MSLDTLSTEAWIDATLDILLDRIHAGFAPCGSSVRWTLTHGHWQSVWRAKPLQQAG